MKEIKYLDNVIPAFEAGRFADEIDNNGKFLYFSDVEVDEYRKYVKLLCENGFEIYLKNEICGNEFATLNNGKITVHIYYTLYSRTVRLIVEYAGVLLPIEPTEIKEKYTQASITQLSLNYGKFYGRSAEDIQRSVAENDGGMSYIVTLEDSTFIIIDGGVAKLEENRTKNCEHLYQKLKRLNRRPDEKIIINAWYITHPHPDHYHVYECFSKLYSEAVTLEKVILNVPSAEMLGKMLERESPVAVWNCTGEAARLAADRFGKDVKIYKPHTGQVFYIKNVKFEMLYTYEDLYPFRMETNYNDTSIVSRMTVSGQTVLWAADAYTANTKVKHTPPLEFCSCEVMVSMFGDYLKSDIVQVAHHGYATSGGAEWYSKVGAEIALWPQGFIWLDLNKKQTDIVKGWLKDAGTKQILFADPDDITVVLND